MSKLLGRAMTDRLAEKDKGEPPMNNKEQKHPTLRAWSGQLVDCVIIRKFLFFILVTFRREHLNPDGNVRYETLETRWYPSWRIL